MRSFGLLCLLAGLAVNTATGCTVDEPQSGNAAGSGAPSDTRDASSADASSADASSGLDASPAAVDASSLLDAAIGDASALDAGRDAASSDGGVECAEGEWDDDGDPQSACVAWKTCQPGELVSVEGSDIADRVCTACAAGSFSDRDDAAACTAHSECEPDEYVSVEGSATADRVCASVSDCAPGELEEAAPTASTDRQCVACASGTFSSAVNAASCAAWTVCAAGEHETQAGSASSDRVCEACAPGYTSLGGDSSCANIDECATDNGGCAQSCHDAEGSYSCSCSDGYALDADGHSCNDVDECATPDAGVCTTGAICTNTVGDHQCTACDAGYWNAPDDALEVCVEIDECLAGDNPCDDQGDTMASCVDGLSDYSCTCSSGFEDTGTSCTGLTYALGGTVSGLAPGNSVTLRLNGGSTMVVSASNPSYTFPLELAEGASFTATVHAAPTTPGQTCSFVSSATPGEISGTMGAADLADLDLVCTINQYTVGGQVRHMPMGESVALQINGGETLVVEHTATFTPYVFPTPLDEGTPFAVTVASTSSPSFSCIPSTGVSATVPASHWSAAIVTCAANAAPELVAAAPAVGDVLGVDQVITLTFNEEIDPGSLAFGSEMGGEIMDVTWLSGFVVELSPALPGGWSTGAARSLEVTFADLLGYQQTESLYFDVPGAVNEAYVSGSTGADAGSCSLAAPCATLAYALSQVSAPAVIRVAAGMYLEDLTLIDGISLYGGHADDFSVRDPSVHASALSDLSSDTPAVTCATGVTDQTVIDGFTIEAATGGGTPLFGASDGCAAQLRNSLLRSGLSAGNTVLRASSGASPTIRGCEVPFTTTYAGTLAAFDIADDAGPVTLVANDISIGVAGTNINAIRYGVYDLSRKSVVTDNAFVSYHSRNQSVIYRANEVHGNTIHIASAVKINSTAHHGIDQCTQVHGNTVRLSGHSGVYSSVTGIGASLVVVNNTITGDGAMTAAMNPGTSYGISASSTGFVATGNRIEATRLDYGLYITGSNGLASDNSLTKVSYVGIGLSSTTDTSVLNNDIEMGSSLDVDRSRGIYVHGGSPVIEDNHVVGTSSGLANCGVYIVDPAGANLVTFRGNSVEWAIANYTDAALCVSGAPLIERNVIIAAGYAGVQINSTNMDVGDRLDSAPRIRNNVIAAASAAIESLGGFGLSSNPIIENNTLHGGGSGVIYSRGQSAPSVRNNVLIGSGTNSGVVEAEYFAAYGELAELRNNAFSAVDSALNRVGASGAGFDCDSNLDGDGSSRTCSVHELNVADAGDLLSGNVDDAPALENPGGSDGSMTTLDANTDWSLGAATPDGVRFGGIDGSIELFGYDDDLSGALRSGDASCTPAANEDAGCWSMGAYEED